MQSTKKRLFYLDFIRAFATVAIIMTHYNALFLYNVWPQTPEKAVVTLRVANVYIGGFGVSLFLIVSGASLMYVYQDQFDAKAFYKKRFVNIFPMFWLAYFVAFAYNFYTSGGMIPQGIPKANFLYSLFGIDMWVSCFGVRTFAIVAEWFLGLILIIYIVFPIIRWAFVNHPRILAGVAIVMYAVTLWRVNSSVTLFARLPEFLFGMYFVKYIKEVKWPVALASLAVLVANTLLKPGFNEMIQILYVGICSFMLLVYVSKFFQWEWFKNICKKICKYSYACFLIHHFVIYRVAEKFDLNSLSIAKSYALFSVVVLMITIATVALHKTNDKILALFKTKD
ncbi:MAG: acyltransferase [Lachnospiraceae bacterium]|nr:acyltransferase [Lachnospiraceae bacterium]